jgi:hypothetical protein
MEKLQRFSAAVLLTFALAWTALAGDIGTPGATAPAPQQSSVTGDIGTPGVTTTGQIPTPGVVALDPVTEAALNLFQSLLLLF